MHREQYEEKDPRWINAKYTGRCAECNIAIGEGDRVLYDPHMKCVFCVPCGEERVGEE